MKLTFTNFSLTSKGLGSSNLWAYQKTRKGREIMRWEWVFIGKNCHQLPDRAANIQPTLVYVWCYCIVVQRCLVRPGITQMVFQKIAYVRVVPHMSAVLFAEHTSSSPPMYVSTRDRGIHPLDLAYVHLLRVCISLLFSNGSRCG